MATPSISNVLTGFMGKAALPKSDSAPAAMTSIQPQPGFAFTTTNQHEVILPPTVTSARTIAGSSGADIYEPGRAQVKFAKGLPVWVNVCASDALPPPPTNSESEIQKALRADSTTVYQIPLFLGPPVETTDEQDKRPIVILDAIIHPNPLARSMHDFDFRLYLIELCIEWVEDRTQMQLSRGKLDTSLALPEYF
ncbi:pre-RNA processing PIH1/Nop17-domain-containing protein [Dimargaris cristalligena]|uniref:Pre-RNA processing PIH1/Nop17-domain-containing protein n=1 Tax=Dimargaris cristalligena TaxID=215637 RepID=A0A4P9ZRG3_9FUNG|nr:pre-RNA processing PIH1/Nop17-domain-containing protein [Dimargaris cristalligena]|eukprot:RKP35758.1 pre-RNA processing PIH1/Nop17-domain-containing protein [Dimargaris cristalligena]